MYYCIICIYERYTNRVSTNELFTFKMKQKTHAVYLELHTHNSR
jgi:hypothetical protein